MNYIPLWYGSTQLKGRIFTVEFHSLDKVLESYQNRNIVMHFGVKVLTSPRFCASRAFLVIKFYISMRKLHIALLFAALQISIASSAAWDIWQAYAIININSTGSTDYQAGLDGTDPAASLVDAYFGRFSSGQSIVINGGHVKTYKNGSSNVCSAIMNYRVYRTCDTPGSFTQVSLAFSCAFPSSCTPALSTTGDQLYSTTGGSTNILSGLTASGTYVVEWYWEITGGDTGGCAQTKYANNGGVNYRSYFEYETTDSFTDGNFSSSPIWSGDATWSIAANSDAASLNGSENSLTRTLRLNGTGVASEYLSTPVTFGAGEKQEWYFFVGRRGQSATAANRTIVWLYANEANLESATVDGYRIVIGDDTGGDEIVLESVTNGTGTAIFNSSTSITNNIIDWGLTFKVTRSSLGRWRIWTSALPTSSSTGATANSCPEGSSTVELANTLLSGTPNYADNTTYTPSGSSFFGVVGTHGSSSGEITGMEFDNFRFRSLTADTYVNITTASSSSVNENATGNTAIEVTIYNPSGSASTSVDLVLASGAATRFGGGTNSGSSYSPSYSTITLTWTAGQSGAKYIYVDPDDNALCDDNATISIQLQNVSGGASAYVGPQDTYTWTIVDDNYGSQNVITEDFNDGDLTSPTPQWIVSPSGAFTASTTTPINGTHSMRSTFTGSTGQTSVAKDLDNATLPGLISTWRFNLQYNLEPNPANKFLVFLGASESDLWSNTVDGYAIGVNPSASGDPDILTLWRVDNGNPSTAIITTSLDWGVAQNIVGFEITCSETGLWTLKLDSNGNFDNLVTTGTPATEDTYFNVGYFGARFLHTSSNGAKLALDDLTFDQRGCQATYYTRQTGNWTDAIWSTASSGGSAPWSSISPSRYTNIVVQTGHTLTFNSPNASNPNIVCKDFTIGTVGTATASSINLTVYGNWSNGGTFNAQTGTVSFKGSSPQTISGGQTTRFNNLTIDSDYPTGSGNAVTCSVATEITGVVSPTEGIFNANSNLTLISNSSGSASIGTIQTAADVTGNLTIQRYIPSATPGWVFLGCPLTGQTVSNWDDDVLLTGFSDGGDGFNSPSYTWVNIYYYDETVTGGRNNGWRLTNGNLTFPPAPSVSNSLNGTRGYNVYMQGGAQTIDLTGAIQKNSISIPVTYTNSNNSGDGWNLVTNPYPSEVDWVAVEATSSDLGTYYVYDAALPGYRAYNANTQTGTGSRYIAHSQAFFVKNTSPSPYFSQFVSFEESHKSNTNAAFERVQNLDISELCFRLERDGLADLVSLSFIEGATDNFENNLDAEYLASLNANAPEFAFVSADGVLLELDARPTLTNSTSIPMYLDLPAAGTYTLSILSANNIPVGSCIAIEDLVSGVTIPLIQGASMTITTSAAYQGNRLLIHISNPIAITTTDATCFGENNGTIAFESNAGDWSYSLVDDMGAVVYSGMGNDVWSSAPAGHYLASITNAATSCPAFNYDVYVVEPMPLSGWAEGAPDMCNNSQSGSITLGVDFEGLYTYRLLDEGGNEITTGETSEPFMSLDNLDHGVYTVEISNNCGVIPFQVDLRDPNAIVASLEASATTVNFDAGQSVDITLNANAPNAVTYNWTLNGEFISDEQTVIYSINTEADYLFGLEAINSNCFSTAEITVTGVQNPIISNVGEASENNVEAFVANEMLQVNFHQISSANARIRLYNTFGQLVKDIRAEGQISRVALDDLAKGVYAVQVIDGNTSLLSKTVVH